MKSLLTKDEFIDAIMELDEADEMINDVNRIFQDSSLNTDFCNASVMAVYHKNLVIKLLTRMFNDVDSWIEYFICEVKYGRDADRLDAEIDGEKICLNTIEDLYELLMKHYNSGEDT
jgi:hypothetical protein